MLEAKCIYNHKINVWFKLIHSVYVWNGTSFGWLHLFNSFTSNGIRHDYTNWQNPYWSRSTRLLGDLRSSWFLFHRNDLHGQSRAWNDMILEMIDFWSCLLHPEVVAKLMCKSQNSFDILILDPVDVDLPACENNRREIFLSKSILKLLLIFLPE